MTYCGQPPHGGYPLTHHELCLGDCGHWDCLGCCGCPSDDADIDMVESLQDQGFGHEWISDWYADQIRKAEQRGRDTERQRVREGVLDYFKVAPKAAEPILRITDDMRG
jgi:hypothetical protein